MIVSLISRSRNEKNIKEWIDYHFNIGIKYIFIYDDFSTPPYSDLYKQNNLFIIRNYERICMNPNNGGKNGGYSQLFDKIKELLIEKEIENIDYILDLDSDEYLYLDNFNNIEDLINNYKPFDQLFFNFLMMGNHKMLKRDSNDLINEFNISNNKFQSWGKSLARYKSITFFKEIPHFFNLLNGKITKNVLGNICNNINPIDQTNNINKLITIDNNKILSAPPCVFHYCVQDIETFIENKVNVERCNFNRFKGYIEISELNNEEDFLKQLKIQNKKAFNYYTKYCFNLVENNLLKN